MRLDSVLEEKGAGASCERQGVSPSSLRVSVCALSAWEGSRHYFLSSGLQVLNGLISEVRRQCHFCYIHLDDSELQTGPDLRRGGLERASPLSKYTCTMGAVWRPSLEEQVDLKIGILKKKQSEILP